SVRAVISRPVMWYVEASPAAGRSVGRCRFTVFFFFSSRRRHTRSDRDWSSDVCSSDLPCGRRRLVRLLESANRGASIGDGEQRRERSRNDDGPTTASVHRSLQIRHNYSTLSGRYRRSEERRVGKEWISRRTADQ